MVGNSQIGGLALALALAALGGTTAAKAGEVSNYNEVTQQRLSPSIARLAAAYAQHGDWNFLRADQAQFVDLICRKRCGFRCGRQPQSRSFL